MLGLPNVKSYLSLSKRGPVDQNDVKTAVLSCRAFPFDDSAFCTKIHVVNTQLTNIFYNKGEDQ